VFGLFVLVSMSSRSALLTTLLISRPLSKLRKSKAALQTPFWTCFADAVALPLRTSVRFKH
jgi:hypothetical protein